jgi:formate dehydrogenase gamma subunit
MTVQLKGRAEAITIQWIPKYTTLERAAHWLHTATFVPLAITGMILYFPFLQPLAQGPAGMTFRLIHRVAAVIFGLLPIVYFIFQPRRLILNIREFLPNKDDIGWLKGAPAYYLLGRHEAMPPQGRFNAGEKMNGLIMIIAWFVFGLTGVPMWFGKGVIPPETLPLAGGVPRPGDDRLGLYVPGPPVPGGGAPADVGGAGEYALRGDVGGVCGGAPREVVLRP